MDAQSIQWLCDWLEQTQGVSVSPERLTEPRDVVARPQPSTAADPSDRRRHLRQSGHLTLAGHSDPVPTIVESDMVANPGFSEFLLNFGHCTRPFNYLGLPAISVPIDFTDNGLPCGMQLVANAFSEAVLFRAAELTSARPLAPRPPHACNQIRPAEIREGPAPRQWVATFIMASTS